MKKHLLLGLTIVLGFLAQVQAQVTCRIEIGIIPPTLCVGNTFCVPYELKPANCTLTSPIRIEISQPLSSPTAPCNFDPPALAGPGNCITIPIDFQKGRYCVRLRSGTIVSDVRTFDVDTIDASPRPTLRITQLPPIRPSYCPDDTVCFKVSNIANAGIGYTIQWSKNDSAFNGATDSVFCITGLVDNDFIYAAVTKQSNCAITPTGRSDTIKLNVNKKPLVRVELAPGSTGCEQSENTFIAKLDSAGPDAIVIWTRLSKGRTDTLSQGVMDTVFTLSPSDSALYGDQVCAEVIAGRCKLKASACFSIKACGKVFLDPPLDTSACAGTVFRVPYTITGTFLPSNVFKVQISDSLGNFGSPEQIGTLASTQADTIRALIPANSNGGSCFKIRIISSAPVDTSDSSGCIRVYPRPLPPQTFGDSVCRSGFVTLSASSTQAGLSFNWYTAPFGGTPVFSGSSQTLFIRRDTTFYVSTISPNGCESQRMEVHGIINPSPNVEAGPDRNLCVGNQILNLTPFPSVGGVWSGALPVLNNAIDLSGVAPGDYRQFYQFTNSLGCTTVDSFTIRVKSIPVVNAGPDLQFCTNNQPVVLAGSPAGGRWSGDNIQSDGSYQPSIASPGQDMVIYSLTVDGCTGSDTAFIEVRQAPPIFTVITTNPTACNIDDGTATLSGITTGAGFKVKWSVNRADSLSDPTLSNLGAGGYTVRVTELATGCSRAGAFGLSDPLAPPPVISGLLANYCSGDSCSTITVSPNSPSGTWSGTGVMIDGNGTVRFCPSQANLGPNAVVYTYDTTGGCSGTTSIIARVNPSPVVNAGGPADTVCQDAAAFQLTGFSPETPPAVWSPQPLVSQTGLVTPSQGIIGINTLTLSRTLAGCSSTDTRNLYIYEKPVPVIVRSPLTPVCIGELVTLTASVGNSVIPVRFEWYKDNNILPNENGSTLLVSEAGSYSVVVVGTGDCQGSSQPVVVNFNALPTNGVTPSGILTPCSNAPVVLTADSSAGYSFQWYLLGDPIVGATRRRFTPTISGQYRVRIENASGCASFSAIINVDILPAPEAPIISPPFADTCLQSGRPITITVGASGSGLSFQWFRVGTPDLSIPGQNDPVLDTIKTPGSYYVDVLASNGCRTRSDTINILQSVNILVVDTLIQKCLGDNQFVVSGFTPNNCDLLYNGSVLPGRLWNPNETGDFQLTYRCSNSNGCVSTRNLTVRVAPLPPANLVVFGPTSVCQGDTVTLVINNGTETGCAYQLIRNGVDFGTPFTTPFVRVTQGGNYSVLVTCSRCSTLSNVLPITFRRKPRASAGGNLVRCSPLDTNLNQRTGVSIGTWSGSPRVTTAGFYNSAGFIGCETLTITVDSSNGCSATDTMSVCINPLPDFTTNVLDATACQAANGSAWVVGGTTAGFSYSWSRVGNTDVLSTTDSLKNVVPGPYRVRITSNLTNCSIVRPAVINSPNNLEVSIAGLPDSICANPVQIQLTGIPADSGVFTSFGNRILNVNRFNPGLPGPSVDTVYYTATLNGCVGTAKKAIKINPLPVVDAGPDVEVCFGDTLVLTAVQPSGVSLIWTGSQVENDNLYVATDPGITSSVVTFGYSQNGCNNTDSKIVRVNPIPEYNVVPSDVSSCGSCDGGAVREIVNSAQFQTIWRSLPGGSVIGTGGSISNKCVGVYTAEVINITTGCSKRESFGISGPTNINPFVCLSNVPTSICQNAAPVTLGKCKPSATIFIGGIQTETLDPSVYIPDNIGVQLSYTDTNGCTGVEQKVVEVKPVPSVNVAGLGPAFACTSQTNVQLTGFFPPYDPSVPENGWTATGVPAGFITKSGRINPSLISDDAVIQLTYTAKFPGPDGCSESKTIPFRVYKTPTATILPTSPTLTICNGTSTTLSSQATGANFTYTWFLGNQSNPPTIGFGPTLEATLPGVYRLQLNNRGCRSDLSGVLVLQTTEAPIIANIGADTNVCQGLPFQLFPPTVIGNTNFRCWQPITPVPDGFIDCSGLINPSAVAPGQYQVRFVASNGTCNDTAFRTFTVVPRIDSPIEGDQALEICQGSSALLVATVTGPGIGYEWTRNGVPVLNSDTASLSVTESGEYRVKILVNGVGTCSSPSTDFVVVSVKPSPDVSITGDSVLKVCFPGPPFDLNTLRPYAPLDATWSASNNIVTPNGLVRPENIPDDGLYTLVLSKTIGTCSDSDTLLMQANRVPSAAFSSSAQVICEGQTIELIYNNPSNYPLTWLRNNSVVLLNRDTLILNQAGTYKLVVDNNGCSAESSADYEVRPIPTFEIPADQEICKNGEVQQFFPGNPSPGLGSWSGPGVNATGGWDPASSDVPASGPITISYTRTSDFGCALTKSFTIQINPLPDIRLESNKDTIEIFGPAVLTASGGISFDWSPSSSLSSSTGPEILARPEESTVYKVVVATEKGCKGEATIPIIVDQEFKIYDGFSPNNDQRNDVWYIKNIQRYPNALVRIFNRWGNQVFESEKGYPKPWDGNFEGNPVPPGAYYYIVDLGQGLTPKSGSITVVR